MKTKELSRLGNQDYRIWQHDITPRKCLDWCGKYLRCLAKTSTSARVQLYEGILESLGTKDITFPADWLHVDCYDARLLTGLQGHWA